MHQPHLGRRALSPHHPVGASDSSGLCQVQLNPVFSCVGDSGTVHNFLHHARQLTTLPWVAISLWDDVGRCRQLLALKFTGKQLGVEIRETGIRESTADVATPIARFAACVRCLISERNCTALHRQFTLSDCKTLTRCRLQAV